MNLTAPRLVLFNPQAWKVDEDVVDHAAGGVAMGGSGVKGVVEEEEGQVRL